MTSAIDETAEVLRDDIVEAIVGVPSNLNQNGFDAAVIAVCFELATSYLERIAENNKQGAKMLIEAMEGDLIELRGRLGMLGEQ